MPDLFERNVHCVLGLPFDALDMAGAVARIRDAAARREPCFFSTPNLNFLVAGLTDEGFRNSVIDSDLSIADGTPIVWVAELLGIPVRERISGSGVFEALRGASRGRLSTYFFGGPDGAAGAACQQLNSAASGLVCVGYECPGIGSVEELSSAGAIARINASGADFLVVSLGAKKGQAWIARNRDRLSPPVISHLGAVLNFVAGTVNRAPAWLQRLGLEWLWRIKEEPKLWRRYLADGLVFLRLLFTHVVPLWWINFRHKSAGSERGSADLELIDQGAEAVIRLRGAWVAQNLRPLRECFSRQAPALRDIRLDLEQVPYVDSAFIGLLMLLYGARRHHGRRLAVGNPQKNVRRIFRYACAEFLLEPAAMTGTGEAAKCRPQT